MPAGKTAILLSTFNGEKYLDECLDSLEKQDWPEIFLFARDDGSTDGTVEQLQRHQRTSGRPFSMTGPEGHLGVAKSFFSLLQHAGNDFEYYAFCDQDDVWLPGKISKAVEKLKSVPDTIPGMYCSRLEYVDDGLRHSRWSTLPRRIGPGNAIFENIAVGCTVMLNRCTRELILAKLPEKCEAHDWWCYLTAACFGQVIYDERAFIKYRLHEKNRTGAPATKVEELTRRMGRFFKSEEGVFRSNAQAREFLECYEEQSPSMAGEALRLLELTTSAKFSFSRRIRLAFSRSIWRQRRSDDLALRLLILLNRY